MPANATAREAPMPVSASVQGGLPDFDMLYDDHFDFVCRNSHRLGVAPAALARAKNGS